MPDFITSLPQIVWPAMPQPYGAGLLACLFQLEATQWQSADELRSNQFRQLDHVVRHAYRTVSFYRRRLDEAGIDPNSAASPERWHQLQLLTRRDIQLSGNQLHSTEVPKVHGNVTSMATSGSTNAPVVTLGTGLTEFFWRALVLREHLWHRRDFRQSLAAIRYTGDQSALPPDGEHADNWGQGTGDLVVTGPGYLLNVQSTIEQQAKWLRRVNPGYVLAYPSILLALAHLFEERGWRLPNVRQVQTFGEILEPECRDACERVFGAQVVDLYSSQEVGYVAIQCSDCQDYHVQSENLLVEILDDADRECRPGEIGRVVVTTLHNFAMPLLRYDIGDYAEVGEQCSCGRGLPVLKRIFGRQRNLLTLPDGRRRWPLFNVGERPEELPPFFQFQVIQRTLTNIEVLVVRHQPLAASEEKRVQRYMQQTLGYPFEIVVRCVESIPRGRSGKFEDFVSEVA